MAIKVTGTTVINDSRELENATGLNNVIRKPTITSPTANETDVNVTPTITGSSYDAIFENTRDYREFQIDLSTGDFSSPVVSEQVNADSFTVSSELDYEESYKVRIRDVDTDGNTSEFSDEVSFSTPDPLTVLGAPTSGGFYMGTITAASTCYYLIVAPNATGCACCVHKLGNPASSTSGACSRVDGFANTYPAQANSTHPAGNWTATRTIGGFSDWYLPAIEELEVFYNNGAGAGTGDPLPAGEDYPFGTNQDNAWASTQSPTFCDAYAFRFESGEETSSRTKIACQISRAVRRIPV